MQNEKLMLSIILPVYNEETAIESVIKDIIENKNKILNSIIEISDIQVLFINDGSIDKTKEIVIDKIKGNNFIFLINHPNNKGYGAALKTGIDNAHGQLIAFYDADNTFRIENIILLLKKLFEEKLDMVSGNRFSDLSQMPFFRKIGNKLYSILLYVLTYKKIMDPSSGIRIIKKNIIIKKLYPLPNGLNFIIVLTTRALFENIKYKEIYIPYEKRLGNSKLNIFKDGLIFLSSIFSIIKINDPFKLYFISTIFCFILAIIYLKPSFLFYVRHLFLRDTDVLWLICFSFFLNISLVSYIFGLTANIINKKIFGKYASRSIIGKFLTDKRLYSKFKYIGVVLIIISVLLYILMKNNYLPIHYSLFILITTLGFYGFSLFSIDQLIGIIEKQLTEEEIRK